MRLVTFTLLFAAAILLAACGCTQPSAPADTTPATTAARTHAPTPATTVPATTLPAATTTNSVPITPQSVSDNTVYITKKGFEPGVITVPKGSQVRWVNADENVHRIAFVDTRISTFLLSPSQSFSQRFNEPGIYDYSCLVQPSLKGSVHVE
jgi:plastocyanin